MLDVAGDLEGVGVKLPSLPLLFLDLLFLNTDCQKN